MTYTNYKGVKFEDVETLPEVGDFFHGKEVKKVECINEDGINNYYRVDTLYKESMFDDDSKGEPYTYYVTLLHKWVAIEEEGREDFAHDLKEGNDLEPDPDYSKEYIKGYNDAKREWLKANANN